jgi:hypothetical protein
MKAKQFHRTATLAALGLMMGGAVTSVAVAQQRFQGGSGSNSVGAANSASASVPMLDRLEKGRWSLTERGAKTPLRSVCVGNMREFIRPEHRAERCAQHVLEDNGNRVSYHYSCQGSGHGHTNILRETNRLIQIDTQGFYNGRPFDRQIEARRIGSC